MIELFDTHFNGKKIFYLSGVVNDKFTVSLMDESAKDEAMTTFSQIYSIHGWGFSVINADTNNKIKGKNEDSVFKVPYPVEGKLGHDQKDR